MNSCVKKKTSIKEGYTGDELHPAYPKEIESSEDYDDGFYDVEKVDPSSRCRRGGLRPAAKPQSLSLTFFAGLWLSTRINTWPTHSLRALWQTPHAPHNPHVYISSLLACLDR